MRNSMFASAAFAVLAFAGHAWAQDAGGATELSEVVVTGEKAERPLKDTQTSVAVTTDRRIEREAIQSLSEVFNRTANVAETFGSQGMTIRGVSNGGVSGAGDAPLSTVYIDGAPMPSGVLFNSPTSAWDVRQIEIFRGPQSTLQGLNALAGAVVLRTQEPTYDWDWRARVMLADPQDASYAVAGGGPIVADQLAFRISAEKRESEGFIRNTTRNTAEDPLDVLTVRTKLLMEPAGAPGLKVQLGYTYFKMQGAYQYVYARTDVADPYDQRVSTDNRRNGSDNETDILSAEASYALSDRLTLNGVSTFSKVDNFLEFDGDNTPQDRAWGAGGSKYTTFTHELRLNYKGERANGLIGAFYYDREQLADTGSRTEIATPTSTIAQLLVQGGLPPANANALAASYVRALPVVPVDYKVNAPLNVKTYALFGDGAWKAADRLSFLGGFRWDHEENDIEVHQTAAFAGTYPNPAAFGAPGSLLYLTIARINQAVAGYVAQAGSNAPPASRDFDAFLPKVGVRYDFTDALNAAFVVQRGYRSGGSSFNAARSQVVAYDPEYTWNYEASLRSAWLGGALTVNANAYYVDWRDQQVTVNYGLGMYDYNTVNAGKAHLYGAELEASQRVSNAFNWYGSLGYSKTEFDDFRLAGSLSDLSGSEFAYAPRWTAVLGGDWRFGGGFVGNLNASYRSKVFSIVGENQAASQVGARTIVNGRFGYDTGRWGLYLYGKNLLDEEYAQQQRATAPLAILGAPRVIGAQLEARF